MTNYEGFGQDNQSENDPIDPSILDQMTQMRDDYELHEVEASAAEMIHGTYVPQRSVVYFDSLPFHQAAHNVAAPQEARALLTVFSQGIEASRAFAVLHAPHFILRDLVSYDEGIRYMINAIEDKSPHVVDAARHSLFAHQGMLREAVQSSSDELAPRRLERILEVIATPPTTPGGGNGGGSRPRHLSIA